MCRIIGGKRRVNRSEREGERETCKYSREQAAMQANVTVLSIMNREDESPVFALSFAPSLTLSSNLKADVKVLNWSHERHWVQGSLLVSPLRMNQKWKRAKKERVSIVNRVERERRKTRGE